MDEEWEELILAEPRSSGFGFMSSPWYHSALSVHRHEKQHHCVTITYIYSSIQQTFLKIILIYFYFYFWVCWVLVVVWAFL